MTDTPVKNRLMIVDFARGIAAFLLVVVHTLWMYGTVETQFGEPLGRIVHMMGQMTAAFLITMGVSFVLTRHQSMIYGAKRAITILLAGYLLNTLKFVVPISVFGTMPENFIEAYGWSSPLSGGQLWYLFLTGDILQMAGVSFLIITVFRRFVTNKYMMLALVVASILFADLMKGTRVGIDGVDYVLDLLWGQQWNVYFPVFPWISNILIGMFIGMHYLDTGRSEDSIRKVCFYISIAFLAIGLPLCFYSWDYHFNDFFHTGPGGAFYLIGINLFVFWVMAKFLFPIATSSSRFMKILRYLSQQVTSIYIIQWVLVCWLMGFFGYQTMTSGQLLLLFPFMIAATLAIDYLLTRAPACLYGKKQGR